MESDNVIQVYRQVIINGRRKRAWWDCKLTDDGSWRVHFHADCVPSTDFFVADNNLFETVKAQHDLWIRDLEKM